MIIERTYDENIIRSIVSHPKVFPWMCEDGSPKPEDWKPELVDRVYYLLVEEQTKQKAAIQKVVLGLFAAVQITSVEVEIHVAMLPLAWGDLAKEAAKEVIAWIWRNIPGCIRIVAAVPSYNSLARKYAIEAMHMNQYGKDPKSWTKNGKLHDRILFGLTRPGV